MDLSERSKPTWLAMTDEQKWADRERWRQACDEWRRTGYRGDVPVDECGTPYARGAVDHDALAARAAQVIDDLLAAWLNVWTPAQDMIDRAEATADELRATPRGAVGRTYMIDVCAKCGERKTATANACQRCLSTDNLVVEVAPVNHQPGAVDPSDDAVIEFIEAWAHDYANDDWRALNSADQLRVGRAIMEAARNPTLRGSV